MSLMMARRPAPVKSTIVLFAPSFVRKLANPAFGVLPQREKLPIGPRPDDAAWWAAQTADDSAPTGDSGSDARGGQHCAAAGSRTGRSFWLVTLLI